MMQKRILVIGGSGFLGSTLCRILHAAGDQVFAIVRQPDAEKPWAQYPVGALNTLPDDFDLIYQLAAHIPYGAMNSFSPALIESNLSLPLLVARRFQRTRLVNASSVAVYGTPLWLPVTEDHPYNRPSAYALSKLAGEVAVAAHPEQITLRFSSLYGAGMTARSFLPLIIEQARQVKRITLFGNGSRTQDFLHVRDAAQMLVVAGAGKGTGICNAVNGRAISNLEAAQTVSVLCPGVEIVFTGEDSTPSCAYSSDRWHALFPPVDTTDLVTGLQEMIAHAE